MDILDERRSAHLERINKTYELQKQNLRRMARAIEYQACEDFAVSLLAGVPTSVPYLIEHHHTVFKAHTAKVNDSTRM